MLLGVLRFAFKGASHPSSLTHRRGLTWMLEMNDVAFRGEDASRGLPRVKERGLLRVKATKLITNDAKNDAKIIQVSEKKNSHEKASSENGQRNVKK